MLLRVALNKHNEIKRSGGYLEQLPVHAPRIAQECRIWHFIVCLQVADLRGD